MSKGGYREGAGRPPRIDGRESRLVRVALTDAEYELLIDATDPDDRRIALMEYNSRYISSWEIHTKSLTQRLQERLDAGKVAPNDTVWSGPGGDVIVCPNVPDEEEYLDYTDAGTVGEVLAD